MKALISDIHGNMAALDVVIRDIETRHVDEILCLGDIVGYGPDPEACIDVVMARARWSLMGNHDHALLHGPKGFNPIAAEMIRLTADKMAAHMVAAKSDSPDPASCPHLEGGHCPVCLDIADSPKSRWQYIENLASTYCEEDVLYVHGSPLDPIFEYVYLTASAGRGIQPGFANSWSRCHLSPSVVTRIYPARSHPCFNATTPRMERAGSSWTGSRSISSTSGPSGSRVIGTPVPPMSCSMIKSIRSNGGV